MKCIFDLGGIVIVFAIGFVYVLKLYLSNQEHFIQIAGSLFAGIATICGLAMGYASIIETDSDKSTIKNAAEKLLHATIFLLF
ncbi:MAG: hypothetical protein SGI87_04015 [Flavobacteriales bacterium]|nr:hypothetical protein [Flavobacteriales bacterium]